MQVVTSGDVGGGQLVSMRVSRALVERGSDVRFSSPTLGDFTRVAESFARVDVIKENSLRDMPRVRRISAYLKSINASLVHTHTPIAASLLWRVGSRLAGVPVVHHVHTANFYGTGSRSAVARRFDRATAAIPRSFIAVSRDTADGILRDGYPKNRVRVIYNPVTWPKEERIRPACNSSPVIGCVGRISHVKGQLELVEAFARVHTRFPGAMLWLIGPVQADENEYVYRLTARARDLGVSDCLKVWGHRDDVRELMKQLTVLALPSHHEAFPLVLVEAMSIGVPVIATSVGGVGELIDHNRTGLLVSVGSVDELAASIESLAGDVNLSEGMSRRAYDDVWSRFDDSATLEPILSLIQKEAGGASRN